MIGADDVSVFTSLDGVAPTAVLHANDGSGQSWWFNVPTLGNATDVLNRIGEPNFVGHTRTGWADAAAGGAILPASTATGNTQTPLEAYAQWSAIQVPPADPDTSADPQLAATGANGLTPWLGAGALLTLAGAALLSRRRIGVEAGVEVRVSAD